MRKITLKTLLAHPSIIFDIYSMLRVKRNTMLSPEDLFQMKTILEDVNKNKIEGSVVEAGCWRGGCGSYMAMKDSKRKVFLLDSFEGMPDPGSLDYKSGGKKGLNKGDLTVSEDVVLDLLKKLKLSNVTTIKGFFDKTIPLNKDNIGKISVLRLDGDFYSSTKDVLEGLYDQVSVGGYVVIDDWHDFEGCRQAVFEFFHKRGYYPNIKDFCPFGKPYFKKER